MKKRSIKLVLSMLLVGFMTFEMSLSAFAANAVIKEDGIRIRSEASTDGTVLESGVKGKKYEIIEEVSASDGVSWYKIKLSDSETGYVRGDLVQVEQTENTATSNAPTTASPTTEMNATINGTVAVNIRSGAGTGYAKVGSLDGGTALIIYGEADDSEGKKWYQIRCEEKSIDGYIRSDFVTVGDPVEVPEEAVEETTEGEEALVEEAVEETVAEPEHNDYEIVYTEDDSGLSTYYMYDHVNNTRQKVSDIFEAIDTLNADYEEAQNQLSTYKILTIAFAAAAFVCLILMIVFMLKAKNSEDGYYEDDYDEEDEEEEYEERSERRDRNGYSSSRQSDSRQAAYQEGSQRRSGSSDQGQSSRQAMSDNQDNGSRQGSGTRQSSGTRQGSGTRQSLVSRQPDSVSSGSRRSQGSYASGGQSGRRSADSGEAQRRPRRSQNFMADDDEFEFEFLNMDDKDRLVNESRRFYQKRQ